METLKIKDRWTDVKKKVLDVYPRLTENDLQYQAGKEDQLLNTLERKTGKKREELVMWLNHLAEGDLHRQVGSGSTSFGSKSTDSPDRSAKSPDNKTPKSGL